jgi:hypothetical protein
MYDRSRLTRLITLALASCCATWALAAGAQARPDTSTQSVAATAAPAFKPAVGDTNKVPAATAAPAFQAAAGDTVKTPNPRQVQRVLNGIGRGKTGATAGVDANNDDTGTIALIVAIVAMLTALAAMTMAALRQTRPVMRT